MTLLFALMLTASSAWAISPDLQKLDQAIDKAIAEKRLVGGSILVSWKGKLIYERHAGMADRENNILTSNKSLYRLSSLSKPIVSSTVLKLVDLGILDLDEPVTTWIPEFRPTFMGIEQVITLRQLLTHTAGLTYTFFEPADGPYHIAGVLDGTEKASMTLVQNILKLSEVPLLFPPGAAWLYSLGTDVVGLIVERATGLSLPEAVKLYTTVELGMDSTDFIAKDPAALTAAYMNAEPMPVRMEEGHRVPFAASYITFSPDRALDESAYPSAGSGMVGTASDYMKFLESVRTASTGLSPQTFNGLTKNQIGDIPVTMYPGCGWSLGFMVVKEPKAMGALVAPGTLQWGGAYGHIFWVDMENELSVLVLTNTSMEALTGKLPADIQMALYL